MPCGPGRRPDAWPRHVLSGSPGRLRPAAQLDAQHERRPVGWLRPPRKRRARRVRPRPAPQLHRVGWGFIALYASAYIGTCLVLLAPLLVTLALKVDSLVGTEQAPNSLALVTGVGALPAMLGNPFFGKLSDRTSSRWGMRRPWMVIGLLGGSLGVLVVALAPSIPVVLSAGASRSCSSTRCSPHWWRCCRTRSRGPTRARSPASWGSACPSRR